ncbi:NUDIX domain-containing protein [Candidatus Soleaferrea massiliensis]|uniref:NUDIX domain-containing protein n=1 Tax=Candidatus Soleaferrea massiliensis TaxID=1470354 RepID=UPI000693CBF0|nr:NUDIX hydrolase [Candidatus Soleaferrea massiliensis]
MVLRDKNGLTEKEFLERYQPGDYPRPSVTADILVFALGETLPRLLLIRRGGHPHLGSWALPGGFANPDESVDEAAARELLEETHITGLPLVQLGMFSDPGRDPRTWVITQAYIAVVDRSNIHPAADDDAADAQWFSVGCRMKANRAFLTLRSDGTELSATLSVHSCQTLCGWKHDIKILDCSGLAFDHAKIILSGLLRLQQESSETQNGPVHLKDG